MADGSIIIDSELNAKGFEAGVKDIKKDVTSLGKGLNSMRSSLEKAFSGNQRSVKAFHNKAAEMQKAISGLKETLSSLGSTKVQSKAFTDLQKESDQLDNKLGRIASKLEKMATLGVGADSRAWKAAEYDQEQVLYRLNEIEEKLHEMREAGKEFQFGSTSEQYAEVARQIDALIQKYQGLIEQGQAFNGVSSRFSLRRLFDTMRNADGIFEQFDSFADRVRNATQRAGLAIQSGFVAAIERVKNAFASLPNLGARAFEALSHPIQTIQAGVERFAQRLNQGMGAIAAGARYAGAALLAAFGTGIKAAISAIGKAAIATGKALMKAFGHGVKAAIAGTAKIMSSIKDRLSSIRKGASSMNAPFSSLTKKLTGLGSMMKRMLTRRLLMSIINGAKEGLQNLAQASPAVNAAMSSLKSSLTQLKNSFATAFGSILPVVLPVLKTLIGWLSTAATYVAQFFSALSGAKTFKKAKAVQEDYAASLNNSTAAAKELKNELLGFDKITKLQDDSSSGSSGAGGVSPSAMFEDAEIDSSIASFVQDLKDAWNAEDFSGVGEIIGKKINEMVSKIDEAIKWDTVGEKITTWVNNIGAVFNSLMDTVDWENIGTTIGDGLNTIIYTLDTFVDSFDLEKLGTALSDIVNGLNNTVDWKKLGTTVSKSINEIASTLNNFADKTNWKDIGKNVATAANNIVSGIDSEALGKALSAKFKIVFETVGSFVKNFDWGKAGVKIGETVNSWFNNIDWKDLGESLSASISGAFNTIAKALETIDWQDLAKKTEEFLSGIDWSGISDKIFEALGAAIGGIGGYLAQLFKDAWSGIKEHFSEYFSWDDTPGEIIKGLLQGIWDAIKDIGTWIKEHIFDPFIEGFKKAFGIHSPSTVMAEMGGYLIEGLKNGLGNIWEAVKEKFSALLQGIKDWFVEKKQDLMNAWDAFKTGITEVTTTIKGKIDETFTATKEAWNNLSEKAKELWANLKAKVEDGFTKAKETWNGLSEKAKDLWTNLKAKVDEGFTKAKATWDGISEKAKDLVANLKAKVEDGFTKAKTSWEGLSTKAKDLLAKLKGETDKTFSDIKNKWDNIKSKTVTIAAALAAKTKETVQGFWTKIKGWFDGKNGKKFEIGARSSATKKDVTSIWDKIKGWWGSHTLGMTGSVTDVSLTDRAKSQLKTSLQLYLPQKPNAKQPEYRAATGGIVRGPTNMLVGEDGPEAIVPLKNHTEWLSEVGKYVMSHIPGLASGTVIPANFGRVLAVLGDNKKEAEVVSPLSTMKKAMIEAMQQMGFGGNGTQNINLSLNLDGQVIYNEVVRINKRRTRAGGVNPLVV